MLKYRLISSFILIPIVAWALFFLPPIGFATVAIIVCTLAAWEWGLLSGFTSYFERMCLAALYCFLLTVMVFLSLECCYNIYHFIVIYPLWISLVWWLIALLLVFFYPDSAIIWRYSKFLRLIFGFLIIVPFFCGMLVLRVWHYRENHYIGALWLLYIMILVWGVDSGSYIFGKLFGKHKLAPKVSPGKTWQGFIGGLITAILLCRSYGIWVNLNIVPLRLLLCSIISVLASVLGDLTESMFKREAGVKDSGKIIPGHGGVLDRIDSLTAAIPVFACLRLLVFETI